MVEDRPEKILGPKVEAIDQNHLMTIWLPEILKTVKFLRVMNRSEEVVVETFAAVEVTRPAINQSVMKSLRKEILRTNLKIPKLVQPHDTPNANRAHLENHAIPNQTGPNQIDPNQIGPKGIGPAEKELKEIGRNLKELKERELKERGPAVDEVALNHAVLKLEMIAAAASPGRLDLHVQANQSLPLENVTTVAPSVRDHRTAHVVIAAKRPVASRVSVLHVQIAQIDQLVRILAPHELPLVQPPNVDGTISIPLMKLMKLL